MRLDSGLSLRVGSWLARATGSTLLEDLVSYWSLDEVSGTRVDAVGDNDLTDNNTVGYDTGVNGNAASFVAANSEYLSYGSLLPDRRADFTISLWFKNTSSTSYQMILTAGQELEFRRDNGVYKIVGILGAATTSAIDFTGSSWTHAVMWYDDAAGKGYFQVNGASAVEMTGTPNQNISSTFLNIGRRDDGYYLDGQVDEVAIWSRVLTADERAELYNAGAGKFYDFS